jgi:hypothetical protein
MGAIARLHFFRLADEGVHCDENGCFVGNMALLRRSAVGATWAARPLDELDDDLSALYGWPIDAAVKQGGLAVVAGALQRGEMALAKIAALLLRFPDPPGLAKDRGTSDLAERLFESGLLRGNWNSDLHPRVGEGPNPGWFAVKPGKGELTAPGQTAGGLTAPGAPEQGAQGASAGGPQAARSGQGPSQGRRSPLSAAWRAARRAVRAAVKTIARNLPELGRAALWSDPALKVAVEGALEVMTSTELNSSEQQAIDQVRASVDPPKTLEQLQADPTENALGYEQHHIVEQNPANVEKTPIDIVLEKFGWDVIDDPENLVWVPRLKHELITALYNSKAADDPQRRLYRQIINAMDYEDQRAAGLAALQMFGVLQ